MNNRRFLFISAVLILLILAVSLFWLIAGKKSKSLSPNGAGAANSTVSPGGLAGSTIAGSPTNDSVSLNTLAEKGMEVVVEYGTTTAAYDSKTPAQSSAQGEPVVTDLTGLEPSTKYYYRVDYKKPGDAGYTNGPERSFHTQRASGSTFSFGVQGDSHPERAGKMFDADLYAITMNNAVGLQPDLYFTLGDDFSIEKLISSNQKNQGSVDQVYQYQRKFLDIVGSVSSVYLTNGNHEQAAKYLLDGTPDNFAVMAANARNRFFPLPSPGGLFGGDTDKVDHVGYLRDYYSFEWGDALFVVIDPYWHSDIAVDNTAGDEKGTATKKNRDLWDVTLGDTQYQWFKQTLENSNAKYKFVFTHHVLGTGRGGMEEAKLYEWGGNNEKDVWEFNEKRPGWELPIQQLMAKNGVTIFFQGHDHLFAKQQLDGVIYQEVPNPADNTYTAFNRDAYKTGDTLPNSGFLNVTVSPDQVQVDYVRSFLPGDEKGTSTNGSLGYSYTVKK